MDGSSYIFQSVQLTNLTKHLNDLYIASWEEGLKTTYYLRNRAASKVEKSTGEVTIENEESEPSACSIEAMQNGESCESCQ
jgi:ribonucleoside-diphosphate reductase alpha chain